MTERTAPSAGRCTSAVCRDDAWVHILPIAAYVHPAAPRSPSAKRRSLPLPLHRHALLQRCQRHLLRVLVVQGCLHDARRERRKLQEATEVALVDLPGYRQLAEGGLAVALQEALPPARPVQRTAGWLGRMLAWLACFRCLALRYERRDDLHLAFAALGCALICLNQIRRFC